MLKSKTCYGISWQVIALLFALRIRQARRQPNDFAEFAFTDAQGRRLRQATIHRELQEFLGEQALALVELPRDHGKSVQVCVRVLWELGRQPALRVKIVCASEALAAERKQRAQSAGRTAADSASCARGGRLRGRQRPAGAGA